MLTLNHICKRFGGKTVADRISLTVRAGEILAVLGRSGCGKSTLLKMTAGLLAPDSGSVCLNGRDITALAPEQRHISLMFQDYALLPHLNVWQNAAFGLKMRGVPRAQAQERAMLALQEVGLAAEAARRPENLSGGERQRLALARALVVQPQLLLLDEAFSSLDTHLRAQLRTLTAERIRMQQIPAVMVTHSPEEACGMADRIAVMQNGRMIQCGTADELIRRPADAETARLFGLPNVDGRRYVPQSALALSERGGACAVEAVTPLPEMLKLVLVHESYGRLEMALDWAQAALSDIRPGAVLRVAVDQSQLVFFD